jgi:hypothetical protein
MPEHHMDRFTAAYADTALANSDVWATAEGSPSLITHVEISLPELDLDEEGDPWT